MPTATRRQVQDILRRLQHFYDIGTKVVAEDATKPKGVTCSRGVVRQFAKQLGVSRDTIEKARQFAQAYNEKDFEDLLAARNPTGMPLGWAHVILLLRVKHRGRRRALQNKATREGWSFERLRQEIRAQSPRRSQGGRRPARPATVEAALLQIDEMAHTWVRWCKDLASAENEPGHDGITLVDLPDKVRTALQATVKRVELLQGELASDQGAKAKSGRTMRFASRTQRRG